ncbi:hypothetical protein HK098_000090 [Nowakowskiella sp. JEL0407]|nr:hypothetical protein HK098_000090 [Nowakowskiella sp. JEL0407]
MAAELRKLLPVNPHGSGFHFSIMSYNVLAQCLVRRTLYPFSSKESLKGKIRVPRVINEIIQLNPDIACLQEIDVFHEEYAGPFSKAGYDFVYHKKNPEKDIGHGLAIIWKREKFEKYDYRSFFFDQSLLTHPTTHTPETGNIFQILALKIKNTGSSKLTGLIITNQHLYWRIPAIYERLRQLYVSMEESLSLRKSVVQESGGNWAFYFCGDLNTCPNDGPYWLLTKKELTAELLTQIQPVKWVSKSKEAALQAAANDAQSSNSEQPAPESSMKDNLPVEEILTPLSLMLSKFETYPKLYSSYEKYREIDVEHIVNPDWEVDKETGKVIEHWEGEPSYTNYGIWKGTLDYIFFTRDNPDLNIKVTGLLNIPKLEQLKPAIPNDVFPSDHISVMAEIEIE